MRIMMKTAMHLMGKAMKRMIRVDGSSGEPEQLAAVEAAGAGVRRGGIMLGSKPARDSH